MTEEKQERDQGGNPIVEVIDLNTNEEVKFHASWSDTLQTIWDKAYGELKEGRRDGDTFECQDGTSLTSHLGLTLEQLREKKICQARKFQIRGPAGGAWLP